MGGKGDLIIISNSNTSMCYKCNIYTLHTVGQHPVLFIGKGTKEMNAHFIVNENK